MCNQQEVKGLGSQPSHASALGQDQRTGVTNVALQVSRETCNHASSDSVSSVLPASQVLTAGLPRANCGPRTGLPPAENPGPTSHIAIFQLLQEELPDLSPSLGQVSFSALVPTIPQHLFCIDGVPVYEVQVMPPLARENCHHAVCR